MNPERGRSEEGATESALSRFDRHVDPDEILGTEDAGAESSTANEDENAASSTADDAGTSARTGDAEGAGQAEGQADDPDAKLPFHKHPRWQEVHAQKKAAEEKAATLERERAEDRRQVEELTRRLAGFERLKDMDEFFARNPAAAEQAEKILRLAGELPAEPTAGGVAEDPAQAELTLVKSRLAQLERGTEAERRSAAKQQLYVAEVQAINASLLAEGAAAEDHQFLGETIHAKYRANRARGSKLSLEQVAKEVVAWRKQDVAATIERYKKLKTAAAGKPPTLKPGGKVPISTEGERQKSKLARKPDGRADPNWADRAGARFETYLREQEAGKSG